MKLLSSVLVAALALAGCDNPNGPSSDLLRVSASNRTLSMTNTSADPVYYVVADKDLLALIDLYVCTDPSQSMCKFVEPGATRRISYSEVLGSNRTSGHAVVYHWRLLPTPAGKYGVDSFRQLDVDLR